MKKTMFVLFGAALMLATPSCKKGANDPGLSLKSRKSRLAGEYTISNITRNSAYTSSGTTYTSTYTYEGAGTATSVNGTTTTTTPVTLAEMTFKKDGTWDRKWNYQDISSSSTTLFETETKTDHVTVSSGTWAFVGKTKDSYKNKERVQLSVLTSTDNYTSVTTTKNLISNSVSTTNGSGSSTDTYEALEQVATYAIDMLKGKEMVFKLDENRVSTNVDNAGTSTTSTNTSAETMTLTQK